MSSAPPIRRHGLSRRLGALGLALVAGAGGPTAATASVALDAPTTQGHDADAVSVEVANQVPDTPDAGAEGDAEQHAPPPSDPGPADGQPAPTVEATHEPEPAYVPAAEAMHAEPEIASEPEPSAEVVPAEAEPAPEPEPEPSAEIVAAESRLAAETHGDELPTPEPESTLNPAGEPDVTTDEEVEPPSSAAPGPDMENGEEPAIVANDVASSPSSVESGEKPPSKQKRKAAPDLPRVEEAPARGPGADRGTIPGPRSGDQPPTVARPHSPAQVWVAAAPAAPQRPAPAPKTGDAGQAVAGSQRTPGSSAAIIEKALDERRAAEAIQRVAARSATRGDLPMTALAPSSSGYVPVAGVPKTATPGGDAPSPTPGDVPAQHLAASASPRLIDPEKRLCPNDPTRIWPWCPDDDEETNLVEMVDVAQLTAEPVEEEPAFDPGAPTADDGYPDALPDPEPESDPTVDPPSQTFNPEDPTSDDGYPDAPVEEPGTSDEGYPDALPDTPPETPMPYSPFRDFRDTLADEVRGTDGLDPGSQSLTFGDFGAVGTAGGDKNKDGKGRGSSKGKGKGKGGVTVKAQHQEIVHTEVDPDGSVDVTAKTRNGPVTSLDIGIPKRAGVTLSTSPQNVRETTFSLSPETTADVKSGEGLPDWSDPQAMNPGDNISARGYEGGPFAVNGAEDEFDVNVAVGGGQVASRPASGSQVTVSKVDADTASVFTGEFERTSTRTDTRIGYFGDKVSFGHSELRDITKTDYSGTRADYDVGDEGAVNRDETNAYGDHLRSGTPQVGPNGTYETVNGNITQQRDITENRASLTGTSGGKNPAPKGSAQHRERDVFASETFTTEHATSRITPTGAIGDDVSNPIGSSTKTTDERREGWPGWQGDAVDIEVSDWVDPGGGFGGEVEVVNEKGTYSFEDDDLNAAARDIGARAPSTLDNPVVADLAAGKSPRAAFDGADIDDINEAMTDLSTAGGTTSLHGPSSPGGATADDGYAPISASRSAYEPAPEPTGFDGGITADDGFAERADDESDLEDLNDPDVGAGDYGGDQTGGPGFGGAAKSSGSGPVGLDAFGGAGPEVSSQSASGVSTPTSSDSPGFDGLDDFGGFGSDVSDDSDVGEGDYGGDQTGGFDSSGGSTTSDSPGFGGLDDFGGFGADTGGTTGSSGSADTDTMTDDSGLDAFGGAGEEVESTTSSSSSSGGDSSGESDDSDGGCFLTTAACEHRGLADDCRELTALRHFRDTWMQNTPELQEQVREYYRIAPGVVAAVQARPDRASILDRMFAEYIEPSVEAIERGENRRAYDIYLGMLRDVERLTARSSNMGPATV